jgi:molecular chaperone GrpE (heat shock protein)
MDGVKYFDHLLTRIEQLVNSNTRKADKLQELTAHNRKLNARLQEALAEVDKLRKEKNNEGNQELS